MLSETKSILKIRTLLKNMIRQRKTNIRHEKQKYPSRLDMARDE